VLFDEVAPNAMLHVQTLNVGIERLDAPASIRYLGQLYVKAEPRHWDNPQDVRYFFREGRGRPPKQLVDADTLPDGPFGR
jgi:hypothetical protein